MKILILSDSHSGLSFMRYAIGQVKPDAVVHLGDFYEDAEAMASEFFHIPFHMVGGNCDQFGSSGKKIERLCYDVCGVRLLMVHGHNENVKRELNTLRSFARKENAQAALFGHTHSAYCALDDGCWMVNPGACGSFSGSVAVIETDDHEIKSCRILRQADLEGLK